MENLIYPINITWVPKYVDGQQNIPINGITQSLPIYNGGYYIANMYYMNISATSSDYRTALDNLLIIATSSNIIDPIILPNKNTW